MIEGLDSLIADLTAAPGEAQRHAYRTVDTNARGVRDDARRFAPHGEHTPQYANSITYDLDYVGAGRIEAEIGPDKDLPQGPLGNIFEFGTSRVGPQAHLGPAFDIGAAKFAKDMANLKDGL